jgi:hypothetical protein
MHSKALLAVTGFALIASQAAAAQQAGQNSAKNRGQAQQRTYCLKFGQETGSHINRTECRTKTEWSKLGIQIDELRDK